MDGREVDLLIETEEGYYAFEIRQAERVNLAEARYFGIIGNMLDKPLLHSFLLSNDPEVKNPDKKTTCMPAAMMLA